MIPPAWPDAYDVSHPQAGMSDRTGVPFRAALTLPECARPIDP